MKFTKSAVATIIAATISISLSACTPPMPPDLLAQIAEQSYTCESGNATVAVEPALASLVSGWQESLASACTDMIFSEPSDATPTNIVISASAIDQTVCKPLVQAPFAFDAGVVEAYFSDGIQVQLSANSLSKILNGQITDWSDPALAEDNPTSILPSLPITILPTADATALKAVTDWMIRLDSNFLNPAIKAAATDVPDFTTLADGTIGIFRYSDIAAAGLTPAAIIGGKDPIADAVIPMTDSIDSAASQFEAKHTAVGTELKLNPNKKPTPPRGSDLVVPPYQAAFAITLTICGENSLVNRAVAKYLLRQDSQGSISSANLIGLPEAIRVESLLDVSKGLPSPKITEPTN